MSRSAPERVREELGRVARGLESRGLPSIPVEGKVLRPLVALASVPPARRDGLDDRFWSGALAVQMVHEASLLHDDVLDGAARRRGRPTLAAERGVGAALVQGDHLLTAAYRAAADTGSPEYLHLFVEAVERTVAGEKAQGAAVGSPVTESDYDAMIRGKSGQLFGCVTALPAALGLRPDRAPEQAREVGLALGALYQRVDDLLDYCPAAPSGKPALQDYHHEKWTWVAREAELEGFGLPDVEVLDQVFRAGSGPSPARRCLARLEGLCRTVRDLHLAHCPGDEILPSVLDSWLEAARDGVERQERERRPAPRSGSTVSTMASTSVLPLLEAAVRNRAAALGGPDQWPGFFARNSRSFRFASWLFPREVRGRIAGIYAFCRFTDDLADEEDGTPPELKRERLRAWRGLAYRAYREPSTGVPLLDEVMGQMAASGVPFHYADALVEGVSTDLGAVAFDTLDELELYTYRVASVVGGWITELLGVREAPVLERAFDLGHAMQLTNILRDVGEDWRRGRLYLPRELMERHGVTGETVARVAGQGGPVPAGYRALLEELMEVADRHYQRAFEALPALPAFYRRPVAVAARVYQGIHGEIRRNGFDNGTLRAWTGPGRKVVLGARGLMELRSTCRRAARSGTRIAPAVAIHADG